MSDTQFETVLTPVSTVSVEQQPLTISVQSIDQSFYQHVAAGYWAWRAVFENDSDARINQHPDFVLTELSFSREVQRHSPTLVICQERSKTVGAAILLPKSIAGEKRFGPAWNLQGYRLAGNRMLGSSDARVQHRLLEGISQHLADSKVDFLLAEDVEASDPLLELVETGAHDLLAFKPAPFQRRHFIELPETHDEYWSRLNSKTRGNLRRKSRQCGECRLERISKPFQIPDFLINAQQVSRRSWQNDLLGLRVHNDQFELELFTFLATQGALRAYVLWQENTPVSFCIGTQHNGVFHFEEFGFDRHYAKMAPGKVLLVRLLEDMYAHERPNVFDFGGGDAEYKQEFGTRTSESGHVWLLRPGMRSSLIMGYLQGRRAMIQALRGMLAKLGLLEGIRRWTRRGLKS